MRSIFVLLILVMIGLNGKGQSVTALPDSVLSQCCLEVTLLNGNVTTVDWVFIQYITRDGSGTKLFVEYAPNFGGIQWETQIRIQDDFDDVLERSKFIVIPFTVGTTDYGINRNWIANIEENTTTGGTWIYGRFGTPTKRKFSAVEDYETMKNLLLACHPRAIVVAENGLYTEGDTVRMGGFLIENTSITTEGYNWQMKDPLSSVEFGLDYLTPETGDTTVYWGRRHGSLRQMVQLGRRYYYNSIRDTTGGLYSDLTHSWNSGDPFLQYQVFNPSAPTTGTAWFKIQKDNSFLNLSNDATNPYYSLGWAVTNTTASLGASESGSGDPGNGVVMGAYGFGTTEFLFMKTKAVDAGTATAGQYLQLINASSGEVDFATIDLSAYLPIADTAAMLAPYVTFGDLGSRPTGSGTADRSARWSATNTLAAGNFTDNGTKVQALLPFQFQTYTTAGLPTGVTGYHVYNTTTNGPGWYQGSRWAYGLESTFNRGTATRVPFFDANGQINESGNLTYTGTRFQTGGSIRIGYNNIANDTASIEKVINTNSKVMRFNSPGGPGGFNGGFEFRGGQNGTVATVNTFRMYTNSTSIPGSVYIGNVTEPSAQSANATTVFGILNKITSSTAYDAAINVHANETGAGANYSLALGKQLGIQIGNNYSNTNFQNFSTPGFFGVFIGYQRQPLTNGYGSSIVLSAHGEGASTTTEVMRLQGKDGNICLGCTNAQYQLYTSNTGAYGIPRGNTGERPTWITGTSPLRWNVDTSAIEVGIGVGSWVQFATRAYTRTLFASVPVTNIGNMNLSLTGNRTLHGSGYSLEFNANTTVRDSFIIGNLPEYETGYITTSNNSTGLQGKKKFLLPNYTDSLYTFNVGGFFHDRYASGFMSAGSTNTSLFYSDSTGFNEISNRNTVTGITSGIYFGVPNGVRYLTLRQAKNGRLADFAFSPSGFDYTSSSFQYIIRGDTFGIIQMGKYGTGIVTPTYTTSNRSNYIAQFATNGTVLDLEIKRDTTIYVTDTDLDWSAAITTAQISARYNRVIFLITTTAAAGSNSDLTLHTPDINLMQVEYLIRSTDEAGGFTNTIQFGSNNAVQSDNTLTGTYTPAAGQGLGIRAGLRSGVYKYFYY